MRLHLLEIENFRGIRHGCFSFPEEQRLICVIGAGDTGKTTLFKAIEWVLWPAWNLIVTDTDFYNCNTENSIQITASVSEFSDELLKEDKFGLFLRDAWAVTNHAENDEPAETESGAVKPTVISIRLTIDASLEPKWEVITNRGDPKPISSKDRKLLSCGVVGDDYEKDFQWGRASILQRYSKDSKDALRNAYTTAMRQAVTNTQLSSLDTLISNEIIDIGKTYGVSFHGELRNRLIMQNGTFSTSVGIFDDEVPFFLRGIGSRRLLSMGMNIQAFQDGTLLLVDEIETGLEPYRISALINEFRTNHSKSGQIFMTTHSVSVICECTEREILVMTSQDGDATLHYLHTGNKQTDNSIQAMLRRDPGAFLCRRIIVCEGSTEIGLLRAFDRFCAQNHKGKFAYYGTGTADGKGGTQLFKLLFKLKECGYDVCVLMDSDDNAGNELKLDAEKKDIPVFSWESNNSTEEQVFQDVPVECVDDLIQLAVEIKTFAFVKSQICKAFEKKRFPFVISNNKITVCGDITNEEKKLIGTVAKLKEKSKENSKEKDFSWYKTISHGEMFGEIAFRYYDRLPDKIAFKRVMNHLLKWVIGNAERSTKEGD